MRSAPGEAQRALLAAEIADPLEDDIEKEAPMEVGASRRRWWAIVDELGTG